MTTRIKSLVLAPLLAAAFAAAAAAAEDDRSSQTGMVESFDQEEGIVVIASERYRMGGARVGPPSWLDETAPPAEPKEVFSPGARVRFVVRPDSQYPRVIERIWLAR